VPAAVESNEHVGETRIAAVGDLMLGDSSIVTGWGFRSRHQSAHTLEAALAGARSYFQEATLVFGNLECVLSESGTVPGAWRTLQMRGLPAYARALRTSGFTVVNVANNHAMQHGRDAFDETVRTLEGEGLIVTGVRSDTEGYHARPARLGSGAASVGILGYCMRPRQYHPEAIPSYAEGTPEAILSDIDRLKRDVDAVVVSLHWGEEFVPTPAQTEVDLAHRIIEAGACLILGHHPHVARPVERHGSGLVAYSLGNFVGDMLWYRPLRHGLLLRCAVSRNGVAHPEVHDVRVGPDYAPEVEHRTARAWLTDAVVGHSSTSYARAIRRSVRAQRRGAYRYVAARLHRFSPTVLWQLVRQTAANKLTALRQRVGSRA
jgi:poly-gamma-glutamate synthesis protein (capsule biosynthesis protein)